jgi:acetyl esterase/lipase
MKKLYFVLSITFLLFILFTSCDPTSGGGGVIPTPLPRDTIFNVSYGNDPLQKMDLYLPKGRTTISTKVILLLHGGGWREGDKSDAFYTNVINRINTIWPDVAIANINYRLVNNEGTIHLPDILADINIAKNYLVTNKNMYNFSTDFGMFGFSAGAHLSMMYTYTYPNSNIKTVGSWFGPADFLNTQPNPLLENIYTAQRNLLGVERIANLQLWTDASPHSNPNCNYKPTIFMHYQSDPTVPISHSSMMYNKLQSLGVTTSFTDVYPLMQNFANNNQPLPIFFIQIPMHDFTDNTVVDSRITNYIRNYSVDSTINFMKRFI